MERRVRPRASTLLLPLGLLVASGLAAGQVAGCFDASLDGCPATFYLGPGCSGAAASNGSTGTSTGTGSSDTGGSSTSSMTGAGGTGQCTDTDAGACPDVPAGPCASLGKKTCAKGVCGVTYKAGPAASQVYGDCNENMCDDMGNESKVEDDTDVFDSGDPCVPYACIGGVLNQNVAAQGASCTLPGTTSMGYCNAPEDQNSTPDGLPKVCAQCDAFNPNTTCATVPLTHCVLGKCVLAHCTNMTQDADETDTDCGGGSCLPCAATQKCVKGSDCFSQICVGSICQAPTCMDNVQNGTETGQDCGGSCPPCVFGLGCASPKDCQSGVCMPTGPGMPDQCVAASCTDGVKNGTETGIDCGSPCPPCAG
jgi:hypothetical protein